MNRRIYVRPQTEWVCLRLQTMINDNGMGLDDSMFASAGMTPMAKNAIYEEEDGDWGDGLLLAEKGRKAKKSIWSE